MPDDPLSAEEAAEALRLYSRLVREEFERLLRLGEAYLVVSPHPKNVVPVGIWDVPAPGVVFATLKFSRAFANQPSWDEDLLTQRLIFPPKPGAAFDCTVYWRSVIAVGTEKVRRTGVELVLAHQAAQKGTLALKKIVADRKGWAGSAAVIPGGKEKN